MIRRAALDLFAQRGFDATSIGDIAAAAGVPKPNVLYYYDTKEELWKDVIELLWQEVDAFYATRLPPKLEPTIESLTQILHVFLEACRRFPAYISLPNLEGHADTWRCRWLAERHIRRHVETFRHFFGKLVRAGVLPDIDPVIFQNIIAGGGQLLVGQERLWRIALEDEGRQLDFAKLYVDACVTLMQALPVKTVQGTERH